MVARETPKPGHQIADRFPTGAQRPDLPSAPGLAAAAGRCAGPVGRSRAVADQDQSGPF